LTLKIGDKQFEFICYYKDDNHLRQSFNALTKRVYGFDFEQWYKDGYWSDSYVPHSLLVDGEVVANSSISIIDFDLNGQKRKYIQIGTVMTAPEYRGLGLSRFLMEKIMDEWKDKCDMLYLFANDSVLSFYPQFGFEKAEEYICTINTKTKFHIPLLGGVPAGRGGSEGHTHSKLRSGAGGVVNSLQTAKKINMDNNQNRLTLIEKIKQAKPLTSFSMIDNIGLIMFYLTSFLKDNVYHIPEYDAYVIYEVDEDVLHLQDVFCAEELAFNDLLGNLVTDGINEVRLGFIPKNEGGFEKKVLEEDDTTLFVFGNDAELFKKSKVRFPVLSRA